MKNLVKKSFLALTVILIAATQGFASNFWADHTSRPTGDTTINNKTFYFITSAEELAWFALQTDHGKNTKELGDSINAILKNDIDLAGKVWTPICPGGGYSYFNGIFDGNGFSVKNMTIHSDSIYARYQKLYNLGTKYVQNAAFIGTLGSGTVKNLTLKDIAFSITNSTSGSSQISVGAVVGWKSTKGNGNGVIDFCSASGTINTSGKTQGVGGLVGNAHSSTIKNSISYVNIIASGENAHVGGIVGLTKNNEVKIESCVYAGEQLVSSGTGSSVGAVVGNVVSGSVKPTNTYYDNGDTDIPAVGNVDNVSGATNTESLNSEDVVCVLNGGTWDTTNAICKNDTSSYWSVGLSGLSLNGSDGYEITFDANGGSFASGVKTTKVLAAGESITADEIVSPTRENQKFAGWATTAGAAEPEDNLGVADASKKIFAVWYDFYDVKFHWNAEEHTNNVAKHGVVSVDGFAVPKAYESDSGKYYFTGWAYEAKWFKNEDYIVQSTDTVRLASIDVTQNIDLYAVWTKARTLSVTFNATLHGENTVQIVRIVNEGDKASEPDTIITDPGYRLVGWFSDAACTAGNEYNFDLPLEDDLVLYAKWEVVDYTISYEMDGGINAAGNPTTYNINSDDIVLAAPNKEGASFDGWFYNYENGEFSNRATQISKGSSFGDKTLYAKWTPIKYTIHYLSGSTIAKTIPSVEKEHGVNIQLKGAVEEFAHKGCVQDGWSTEDLGDKVYDVGATYDGNADLMLYPHWNCNTYTITYNMFDVEGAENYSTNPSEYTGPVAITLANANDSHNPTRFRMLNWYLEPTFKTVIRNVQDIDSNITVYARWLNDIVYQPGNSLNGTGAKKVEETKFFDKSYTLKKTIANYTRDNYTLDGWSTTDGGDKVYDLGQVLPKEFHSNLTLYPHWVENCDSSKYGAVTIKEYADRTEAIIDGSYEGNVPVEIESDITVDRVTLNRTFTPSRIASIMLPFSVSASKISGVTKIYKFNRVAPNDEGVWTVRVGTVQELNANTPYMVLPSAASLSFNLDEPVVFNTTNGTKSVITEDRMWEFRGVYVFTTFEDDPNADRNYGFAKENANGAVIGQFTRGNTETKIGAMRGYMIHYREPLAKSASIGGAAAPWILPEEILIEVEDEKGIVVETGKINSITGEVRMDRWFDLKGRKLNAKPTTQGTYYRNNSRVIIK